MCRCSALSSRRRSRVILPCCRTGRPPASLMTSSGDRLELQDDPLSWSWSSNVRHLLIVEGPIPKCGHVALVLDCCYVDMCVIFSSSGSLRMRLISQFSRASGARFSETNDSPETVVGGWILPAKLNALLGSSTLLSQVVLGKGIMAESKSPLFGIAPSSDSTMGHRLSGGRSRGDMPHVEALVRPDH